LVKKGRAHDPKLAGYTANDARDMVIGLSDILSEARNDRDTQSLVAEEVTFYGTLMAITGISLDSRAARNTGGVLAGLATLFTGHYKPSDQSLIFDKAAQRANCLEDLLRPVTPEARQLFPDDFGGDAELAKAYTEIPSDTVAFIDTISKDLNAALKAVTLSSPSKDDLANTMQSWKSSKDPANHKDVGANVQHGLGVLNIAAEAVAAQTQKIHDEMQAFSDAVKGYHTGGAACLVQHTQ